MYMPTKELKKDKVFEFVHQSGDKFTYDDKTHEYTFTPAGKDSLEMPGTTTPLKLVNELSWDSDGKMIDEATIIQLWLTKKITTVVREELLLSLENGVMLTPRFIEDIIKKAKAKPKDEFKDAGVSGTEIHALCETYIKKCIKSGGLAKRPASMFKQLPQVQNFINWAVNNRVEFLYSEEPLYSKEWMNCGTVDFICKINGKILVGDIKTNGSKRRYEWDSKAKQYDFKKPVSDIHVKALWQTGCYGKMATEETARKLIDKFDGVVIVNIKKSGEFEESLDTKYYYDTVSLIESYSHVIGLYKLFKKFI